MKTVVALLAALMIVPGLAAAGGNAHIAASAFGESHTVDILIENMADVTILVDGNPVAPGAPALPGAPDVPALPGAPEIPALPAPEVPATPDIPALPAPVIPAVPSAPGLPALPTLP